MGTQVRSVQVITSKRKIRVKMFRHTLEILQTHIRIKPVIIFLLAEGLVFNL